MQLMLLGVLSLFCLSFMSERVYAYSFSDALTNAQQHDKVQSMMAKARALEEEGHALGSWGDPHLMLNALNFPADRPRMDVDPMTGIEVGISQNIPLTNKYNYRKSAQQLMGKSMQHEANQQGRALIRLLWNLAIRKQKLQEDLKTLKENQNWIDTMLTVSKRLYANGKASQQSVLELQIRKAELESSITSLNHSLKQLDANLSYLVGKEDEELELSTVPWTFLSNNKVGQESIDSRQKALEEAVQANELMVRAQKLALVPDLTFTVSYMRRNFMNMGDLVSAGVTFPLPLSDKEHAGLRSSLLEKRRAEIELRDYKFFRQTEITNLDHQIQRLESELKILKDKTIVLADQSREVTARSYGVGSTSYLEITRAELKLQDLQLRKNDLKAQLLSSRVEKNFLAGEALYGP
jgi:outer membrane protein, heavy metal efflux system